MNSLWKSQFAHGFLDDLGLSNPVTVQAPTRVKRNLDDEDESEEDDEYDEEVSGRIWSETRQV